MSKPKPAKGSKVKKKAVKSKAVVKKPSKKSPSNLGASLLMLSKHFTMADLTHTSYKGVDNTPQGQELLNLQRLGALLDRIVDEVGPIRVVSAYRSVAVQNRLREKDLKNGTKFAAVKKSFHEAGLAADIQPLKGNLEGLWAAIITRPWATKLIGEFAIKPEEGQRSLHIVASVPGVAFKPLIATAKGGYVKLTANQISTMVDKYRKPVGLSLILVGLSGLALMYMLRMKKAKS